MTTATSTPSETGPQQGGARLPALLSSAGRHRLAGHALAHPVRTILVVYAVTRVVALLALWVAATWFQTPAGVGHLSPTVGDMLGLWDSVWYKRIAVHGYPLPLPADPDTGTLTYSAWAFYPLYPMMVRGLMVMGLPFTAAAVALSVSLGAAGSVLVWKVFHFSGHADPQPERDRLALVAAVLWCFYPATGIMLKPYTESLAVVLVAGSVVLLMRRRYAAVAVVSVPLGLTRGVAPAMGVTVLIHLSVRWREDRAAGLTPLGGQRLAAGLMLVATAVSGVAWPVVVGLESGIPSAFFDIQAAWGQDPGKGPFVLWLSWAWDHRGLSGVVVLVALLATYIALVLGRHGRWLAVEARAWALAYPLYLFAVLRPITSMWRFLLLDFPLTALVASVAMRTSTGAGVVAHWRRRVAVVVLFAVAGVFWWTCTLLVYPPWGSDPP